MRKNLSQFVVVAATIVALSSSAVAQVQPLKVTMVGGTVGGAWSAIGSAIGEAIRREAPGSAFSYEPGRESANIQLVASRRVELAIVHEQMALRALRGGDPFKGAVKNVRAIALLDPLAVLHLIGRADFTAQTLKDVADKRVPLRVTLNPRGTLTETVGQEVLRVAGFPSETLDKWGGRVIFGNYVGALDALKNGQTDFLVNLVGYPSGQLVNATREMKGKLYSLTDEEVAKIEKELGMRKAVIPANTYSFQTEPVQTVSASVILIAAAEMPDEQVATIVRGIVKNFDYLKMSQATLKRLDPSALPKTGLIPLHPAAERVYREAGLLK